jgi:uncharacterized membrane protein required for colicin V production
MTIWLLALVLLASLAALGYRQGAIRVGFSFVGILLGLVLAAPLGGILARPLAMVGLKNPLLAWMLPPFLVFVIVLIVIKIVALNVHEKVEVFYKYHAGDLRLALWERLNRRLGLCLGLLNGATYFLLICGIIFAFSYWTVQVAAAEKDPKWMRVLNYMGRDLQSAGFAKPARSIAPMPPSYYDMADFAGFIYRNPLAQARLSHYPAYLELSERPEFQDFGGDTGLIEMWQRQDPIMDFYHQSKIQAILNNPDLLRLLWNTTLPNRNDIYGFLQTGKSAKYDEKILGRWNFDANAAFILMRRAKPNIPSSEMQKLKVSLTVRYAKASLLAMPNHSVLVRNLPGAASTTTADATQGKWKNSDGKYQLNLGSEDLPASVEGDRLTINQTGMDLVFTRED